MKANRSVPSLPIVLLALFSVSLLALVGFVIGVNIRLRREPVYRASLTTPSATAFSTERPTPTASTAPTAAPSFIAPAEPTPNPIYPLGAFTDRFWADGILSTEREYRSPGLSITYRRVYDTETFSRRETYFVAEIFVSDVTQIRTANFNGDFSKNGRGYVETMAKKNDAIVAISGDYYGFRRDSLVIRNGTVYRTKLSDNDVCLLLRDGTMQTIRRSSARIETILEMDPWQAWQFGPALFDEGGVARTGFPDSSLNARNPRSCIGYAEPGHYFFVVVDGRQKYARGLTLAELASLMETLGCVQAFNLDGGASAHFFWNDRIVSSPSGGGRQISDIIYIAKEAYPVSPYYCGKDGLQK